MRGPTGSTGSHTAVPILSAVVAFVLVLGAGLVTSGTAQSSTDERSQTTTATTTTPPKQIGPAEATSPEQEISPPTASNEPEEANPKKKGRDPAESDTVGCPSHQPPYTEQAALTAANVRRECKARS